MEHLAAPALARLASLAAALGALALITLAAPALAQAPGGSLTLSLDQTSVELGAANTTTVAGTIRYDDQLPTGTGGITLSVTAPDGWTATIDPAAPFALNAGQEAPFTITFVAPAAGLGAATGSIDVSAAGASGAGRNPSSATAAIAVTRIDPPPVVIPWYQTTGGIIAIAGAIVVVAGSASILGLRRRNARLAAEEAARKAAEHAAWLDRETGITLAVGGGPIEYGHKREVIYRVNVSNRSQRPRVAIVDVAEVTNGWRANTQVTKIPLSVGETQPVTVIVAPDLVIKPGDSARVIVRARPEEAREKDERIVLDITAPKHGVPTDPHYRIVTVHREGANNPVQKR